MTLVLAVAAFGVGFGVGMFDQWMIPPMRGGSLGDLLGDLARDIDRQTRR